MQQIERYGVIALVFLLVTIVAVSFWGDTKSPGFWSRLTGRGVPKKEEVAAQATPPATLERALDGSLPLSPAQSDVPLPEAHGTQPDPAYANHYGGQAAVELAPVETPPARALSSTTAPYAAATPPEPSAKSTPAPKTELPRAATKPASTADGFYVIRKDDSLVQIAQSALGDGKRWRELQALNPSLDPRRLPVGAKIRLPARTSPQAAPPAGSPAVAKAAKPTTQPVAKKGAPTSKAVSAHVAYVVRTGDTLRSIAQKQLGDSKRWRELVALNPGLDPNRIPVGRTIQVPGAAAPLVAEAQAPRQSALGPRVR